MLFSAQQFIIAILHYFVKAQLLRFRPWRADFLRLSNAGAGGRILSERMGEIAVQNLIFSLNATLPVFLTMVAGGLLQRWGFLPKEFCRAADKLTFKVTLPVMLFLNMSSVDIYHDFQPKFVLFCFAATLIGILVIWGAARVLVRDKAIVGD